jgi:NADPH:quinone reductase-like Zn-dependent oxidoreductase
VNEEAAVRAPSHLDAVEACTLPVAGVTAWHALYQTHTVRPGETVLIQGSGGVSVAALQLARAGGARVISVIRTGRHEARLRALGAGDVIALGDTPDWPAAVGRCTGGRGVDVALDVVGGAQLARTIATTRHGGHVHLVGYVGDTSATIDIYDAIRHGATIHVATAGSRASFEAMNRALELHAVRPVVDRVFRADQWADAFEQLGRGGQLGKIAIALP